MNRILIVEDEPISLRGLQAGIDYEALGFSEVYTADNICDARKILEQHEIAVMLCDIEMPGGNGLELQEWLCAHCPLTMTVFLSCHANFSYAQQSVKLGAFDYVLKPAPYDLLAQTLAAALKKHSAAARTRQLEEVLYSGELSENDQEKENAELIERIEAYVMDNLSNELGREQIGAYLYLNPDYVARVFKKAAGISLSRYIFNTRLQVAKTLLVETNASVGEICEKIGYMNHSHFTKVFKKEVGMTPVEYRKQYGENDSYPKE